MCLEKYATVTGNPDYLKKAALHIIPAFLKNLAEFKNNRKRSLTKTKAAWG